MGHKIEFDKKPFQGKIPTPIKFNDTAINLIQEEVSELLSKGAIKEVCHEDDIDKTRALIKSDKNYNANMIISEESRSEIRWWLANVDSENGKLIREVPPSHSLHTDSSMKGWGAFLDKTSCSTQGRWNLDEQNLHINVLELKAIYFGLISLSNHIKDAHVRIGTLLKTSRPKKLNQEITVASFCKPEICPLKTLKHYILRTQNVRKSNKLFVSFKTLKAVTSCSIARWLKVVLINSGIDISKFKAHSYRSASSSAALNAGKGVFTTRAFMKGEFLLEYEGKLMSSEKGDKRLDSHVRKGHGCYVFFFRDNEDQKLSIDATNSKLMGRYVNDGVGRKKILL
ncbi:unnamed protein product [Mytilus coruscus]|uniref:SET domain-containing protein n=1 Tax=Mytilus coruscus TaxID=42192 RepID=A0A6J8CQD7_MYTCO|nr:unnamed protein product [Mytilus coruscus]